MGSKICIETFKISKNFIIKLSLNIKNFILIK